MATRSTLRTFPAPAAVLAHIAVPA
jgi:hypothetical protein